MELSGNVNNLSGDAAIAFLREQEAIRRARSKRRWITVGAVLLALLVLMVGCGVAVGAAASGGTAPTATSAPTAPAASSRPLQPRRPSNRQRRLQRPPAPTARVPTGWATTSPRATT